MGVLFTYFHPESEVVRVGLTVKQQKFVDAFVELGNATQAEDAIATMLDGETYPEPQDPSEWKLDSNQRIIYISVDMDKWLKKNTQTVRRTITVPQYLNDLAKERKVNVSRIATDALKAELGV